MCVPIPHVHSLNVHRLCVTRMFSLQSERPSSMYVPHVRSLNVHRLCVTRMFSHSLNVHRLCTHVTQMFSLQSECSSSMCDPNVQFTIWMFIVYVCHKCSAYNLNFNRLCVTQCSAYSLNVHRLCVSQMFSWQSVRSLSVCAILCFERSKISRSLLQQTKGTVIGRSKKNTHWRYVWPLYYNHLNCNHLNWAFFACNIVWAFIV